MNIIKRYLAIFNRMKMDPTALQIIQHNQQWFKDQKIENPTAEVLVEYFTVPQTVICFSYFSNVLAAKHQAKLKVFSNVPRNGFLQRIAYRKFLKIFSSFNCQGYFNVPKKRNRKERKRAVDAIMNSFSTKEELLKLSIEGLELGTDIYETYIRELAVPTANLTDPKLRHIIEYTLDSIQFWKDYFSKHQVKAVILSHACYRYGCVAKVALRQGISVYRPHISGLWEVLPHKKPGVPDFPLYPKLFRELSEQEQKEGLKIAEARLKKRFSAEIGVDMSYATESSFGKIDKTQKVLRESNKPKVLIAAHCFFDNPHSYGGMLFPDFYEWMVFLGNLSNQTDYDWYLKTHPYPLPGNEEVLQKLLETYPKILKIPPKTSFHQLIEEGISVVLTAYGTVGHELPLLGTRVVNAGYNPHVGYEFNIHPQSIADYRKILLNLDSLTLSIKPEEIFEFYFTHYCLCRNDDFIFDSYNRMISTIGAANYANDEVYKYFLKHFNKEKHLEILKKMKWFLDSGDTEFYNHRFKNNSDSRPRQKPLLDDQPSTQNGLL